MKLLFIHQNMPGQYVPFRLAQRFLAQPAETEFCSGPQKMDLVPLKKLTIVSPVALKGLRPAPS